jgi:hypothetical protein
MTVQPASSWQMVLDQLRLEMSMAHFNTWVHDKEFYPSRVTSRPSVLPTLLPASGWPADAPAQYLAC